MRSDPLILEAPAGARSVTDHLSHLTLRKAEALLGPEGRKWIADAGRMKLQVEGSATLTGRALALAGVGGQAKVEIRLREGTRRGLELDCDRCGTNPCLHQAAALSFVLEEKVLLGLALPPEDVAPVEAMSEAELIQHAIREREARAAAEPMRVEPVDVSTPWTDYTVTSRVSGRSYRVALRGWERGQSYCSCPDFRKNTLGLCKHTLQVAARAKRKFPASVRKRPWKPDQFAVSLNYGAQLTAQLEGPDSGLAPEVEALVRPLLGQDCNSPQRFAVLLTLVRRLERLQQSVVIYPDAEEFLTRALDRERIQKRVQEIRRSPATHPLRSTLLRVPLLPYQMDGIAFAVGAGRSILADDMGLGKTIQGIGVAEMLAREAGISRVLVVCPASLKSQWAVEVGKFSHRDCQMILGGGRDRGSQYSGAAFFTICNYEQVTRDHSVIEQMGWDLIILDEGQRIKNWEAKTSRIIKALRSPYALVLSGTPLENRLDELFSVMEFIDERRLGPAFRFFHRHRVIDDKGKVTGYRRLDEIRRQLRPVLLRRTRASVLGDLPPRTTEVLRIPPSPEQAAISMEQLRIASAITRKKHLNEMDLFRLRRALLVARLAADSTALIHKDASGAGHSSKLERLRDLLAGLVVEEDRKMVIFSEWTSMLNLIEPLLQEVGLRHVRLEGSIPQRDRQALVTAFQTDPGCRVFLTTNAGSTGLNLQAANTIINVDLPWNPAVLEQRIARAHRMGQSRPVQVYLLVTEGTIEENLLATLSAKHELARAALDFDSELDEVDLVSGLEDLKRRLEVLLGKPPEVEIDEVGRRSVEVATKTLASRRTRVEAAGGELLGAALSFLSEILPAPLGDDGARQQLVAKVRASLGECLETDSDGRVRLSVTLPDAQAVDRLADALCRLSDRSPLGREAEEGLAR